jgi:hypothetical protein
MEEERNARTQFWSENCTRRVINLEGNIKMNVREISHEVVRIFVGHRGELTLLDPLERISLNLWTQNKT